MKMGLIDIKKTVIIAAIGLMMFVVGSGEASAQNRREIERERQRIEREQRRNNQRRNNRGTVYTRREVSNAYFVSGYQQGLQAGEFDRRKRKYNQSNVYRNTGSAPNSGDPSSGDYIYRQGYLEGYNDGFNGRRNY
jgi:hypothetical protein